METETKGSLDTVLKLSAKIFLLAYTVVFFTWLRKGKYIWLMQKRNDTISHFYETIITSQTIFFKIQLLLFALFSSAPILSLFFFDKYYTDISLT